MTDYERRSYRSFVLLYLVSTFVLISAGAYWYYASQTRNLEGVMQYRMQHLADEVSSAVIYAHMNRTVLNLPEVPAGFRVILFDREGLPVSGDSGALAVTLKQGSYRDGAYDVLVTTGTNDHLGIRYVAVATDLAAAQITALRHSVIAYYVVALLFVTAVGSVLSRLFLQPIRRKVEMIDRFIKDLTHELNTPITALSMSSKRAMQKGECDARTLRNISASTKQLYDIYSALAYLSFDRRGEYRCESIDLETTLASAIAHFDELAQSKGITFTVDSEPTPLFMAPQQATMLVGNLISNAIKYSHPGGTVTLLLKGRVLMVRDEGIGIEKEKLPVIFERYQRGTEYAGGFGVGLSVVKSICDTYAITLKVVSEPGYGTTVMLMLPEAS